MPSIPKLSFKKKPSIDTSTVQSSLNHSSDFLQHQKFYQNLLFKSVLKNDIQPVKNILATKYKYLDLEIGICTLIIHHPKITSKCSIPLCALRFAQNKKNKNSICNYLHNDLIIFCTFPFFFF